MSYNICYVNYNAWITVEKPHMASPVSLQVVVITAVEGLSTFMGPPALWAPLPRQLLTTAIRQQL